MGMAGKQPVSGEWMKCGFVFVVLLLGLFFFSTWKGNLTRSFIIFSSAGPQGKSR